MTTDHTPRKRSHLEQRENFHVSLSRALPHALSDGRDGVEYQYVFLRDGERVGAMGFFGPQELFAGYPHSSRIYTFDLTLGHVVDDMLRLKRKLGSTDDDFQFIRSLAAALVLAASRGVNSSNNISHVAVTSVEALASAGVSLPAGADALPDGTVALAELITLSKDEGCHRMDQNKLEDQ